MTENTEQTREALKAGLAAGVNDLTERAGTLIEETRKERRQTRWLTWIAFAAVVVILAIAAAVGYELGRLNGIADTNKANGVAIRSTLDAIESCTTPAGACAQRSQAQTGAALSKLLLGFCGGLYPHDPSRAQACGVAALKALQ